VPGEAGVAVVGEDLVHDELVGADGGGSHAGGVLEELRYGDAVAVQDLQRALPAVGVGGHLEDAPAANTEDGVARLLERILARTAPAANGPRRPGPGTAPGR
jgi:hypothetical protein